ncbi:GDP-Man:Man(3) c(2)-PP-Dol alpha-1,2-mannosyltransferase [Micractinium conductrix]|uniref:GDP-Man:Man(3)GlcNAc(2)-PP-Dol alpha-1,2-mannosyltransferase n=1 Tax=Micractinium conductrix TaxID=554055 RepID=A0A2P6V6A6_9CHLO|nr:GDP-Man:Man(3) c(2)-PP-Dol alpha-1,2-mannosyltransferase [Micractinium conductrix]|eukprot:PSC69622.1 GDP-Man:Man(3) c(2)-PP-Dol alpha-1,2-mannosyltransferase [Micractinium conductrix]
MVIAAATTVGCLAAAVLAAHWWIHRRVPPVAKGTVAFFHPFADGGGGGERVLWAAVQALQMQRPDVRVAVYCGGTVDARELCKHVLERFNLSVQPTFTVVPLPNRDALLPGRYPRFTMLAQAAASVAVAWQGLRQLVPELWIDTTGWAFQYPLTRLAGARVAAYVHYPTISTDMLQRVWERNAGYTNSDDVAASPLKSLAKLAYYHAMALLYGCVGAFAQVVMVNSSWTRRHIAALWWQWRRPQRVYPPCDTRALQALPLDRRLKRIYIVSVAQFRPEKDHALQLRALAAARDKAAARHDSVGDAVLGARLRLIGSCRNAEDEARIAELAALAEHLGIGEQVEFVVNASFDKLRALLGDAVAGLHTMVDEHFGISVVEYMAAGVVPIAHDSGGPRKDIVLPEPAAEGAPSQPTGYRCTSLAQYADAIIEVVGMEQVDRLRVAGAARRRAAQFSDQRFQKEFLACLVDVLPLGRDSEPPRNLLQ